MTTSKKLTHDQSLTTSKFQESTPFILPFRNDSETSSNFNHDIKQEDLLTPIGALNDSLDEKLQNITTLEKKESKFELKLKDFNATIFELNKQKTDHENLKDKNHMKKTITHM